MSKKTIFSCDCCGNSSPDATSYNNGPGNKLINSWNPDSLGGEYAKLGAKHHYCQNCIAKINEAIDAVFSQYQ